MTSQRNLSHLRVGWHFPGELEFCSQPRWKDELVLFLLSGPQSAHLQPFCTVIVRPPGMFTLRNVAYCHVIIKKIVVGILRSREREGAYTLCNGMDETGEHYAK